MWRHGQAYIKSQKHCIRSRCPVNELTIQFVICVRKGGSLVHTNTFVSMHHWQNTVDVGSLGVPCFTFTVREVGDNSVHTQGISVRWRLANSFCQFGYLWLISGKHFSVLPCRSPQRLFVFVVAPKWKYVEYVEHIEYVDYIEHVEHGTTKAPRPMADKLAVFLPLCGADVLRISEHRKLPGCYSSRRHYKSSFPNHHPMSRQQQISIAQTPRVSLRKPWPILRCVAPLLQYHPGGRQDHRPISTVLLVIFRWRAAQRFPVQGDDRVQSRLVALSALRLSCSLKKAGSFRTGGSQSRVRTGGFTHMGMCCDVAKSRFQKASGRTTSARRAHNGVLGAQVRFWEVICPPVHDSA